MITVPPAQLLLGSPEHGVVSYAADLAHALRGRDPRIKIVACAAVDEAVRRIVGYPRVHLHVTDRLLGDSPEDAADAVDVLAGVTRLTITAHDLPQTSDGDKLRRRADAYARMFGAAEAVAVNSHHEQLLVEEYLLSTVRPHSIPLGARHPHPAPRRRAGGGRLVILLAGYVYPGKGHVQAIRSAADAAKRLRQAGVKVDRPVVVALGAPSAGHEKDVDDLRSDAAALGVDFEITGFLDADSFTSRMRGNGIPLAAHEHISASRTMLDWIEAGRRPLVAASRYAEEMERLRPGTLDLYDPHDLDQRIADAWADGSRTWLPPGITLAPTLTDVAGDYLTWWQESTLQ